MDFSEALRVATSVSEKLFFCVTVESVENVFTENKIKSINHKISLLRICMGVKDIDRTPNSLTIEQEYQDELLLFLEGSWRFLI